MSATPTASPQPGAQPQSTRKGRGSQVFTQEMACALVNMYIQKKTDFPGTGYSIPAEAFEAIASELRQKFNVTSNEIDQQTLKKKLSNIRTRVRNRCRDVPPDADLTALNLTPSEQIYFRYFGPLTGSGGSGGAGDEASGNSTPLPNGVGATVGGDTNGGDSTAAGSGSTIGGHDGDGSVTMTTRDQNGHSSHDGLKSDAAAPLNDAATTAIVRIYAEHMHLFAPDAAPTNKNVEQQRYDTYDTIRKHLLHAYRLNVDVATIGAKIDEVVRSLASKVEDSRRLSGIVASEQPNLVLRPPNLSPPEAELFDAQFSVAANSSAAATSTATPPVTSTSSAGDVQIVSLQDIKNRQEDLQRAFGAGAAPTAGDVYGSDLYLVPNSNGVQNAALAAAAVAAAAAAANATAASTCGVDAARLAALAATPSSLPPGVPPPPLVTVSAPGEDSALARAATALLAAPASAVSTTLGVGNATASSADPSPQAPNSRARKNNKRKAPPTQLTDEELDRQMAETFKSIARKTSKLTVDERRAALIVVEKQRALRAQRALAEERISVLRHEMRLVDERTAFYKVWTEVGTRLRGFLRP